ncbi:type II secretion system protein [Candidatus Scalindua japonica]|uniref:type II secretion system protein n=1 Tax=Candidatus Scalindua japonica TaxID=1284222 RepID=UPI000BDEA8CE|nr:prepilin-type N-terminal cleavage/methylation domain-containing protein [Candidatus Scalindua japonica]
MKNSFCKNRIWDLKSERGFTLVELVMIITVTGVLSSTLVVPFATGIKQGTRPEIYATATYLAQKEIEELKNAGYTIATSNLGNVPSSVTLNGRLYTENSTREYVSHSGSTFTYSASPTDFIRVTESVSNSENADVVTLWAILAKDFYNPNAN